MILASFEFDQAQKVIEDQKWGIQFSGG